VILAILFEVFSLLLYFDSTDFEDYYSFVLIFVDNFEDLLLVFHFDFVVPQLFFEIAFFFVEVSYFFFKFLQLIVKFSVCIF
jgi:hypothetical protein